MFCHKMLKLQQLYRTATILALTTIFYNIIEGMISIWLGATGETISLFGFGLDSFVEVTSGIGVWHMIRRIGRGDMADRDSLEQRSLRITGGAFYLPSVGLTNTSAVISLLQKHQPITTTWGIAVSVVSIVTMQALMH